ncbi:esterase/lipase family protein [Tumebacillus flagellatus]|uniref:Alpha/beta hydrolase n=1 Tax=Tumebacillus flagellatus TaxID=1157490 RepID=A0A074LTM6_9BACL|nr:alpha/beta hydrolase [Tumebacillus flagellatus]KEO83143.1 alpha/beta hydrolase [Tumebacillus flagellatus]
MAKRFVKLATAALLLGAALNLPQAAHAAAPAPTLHNDNATANFGDWYTGAIPSNVDYSKPVILFVQGLHSDYTTWTATDAYYDAAYNAGYRTAFVQLRDADGNGGNPWTNGPVLADVIKKVANYYGVPKINIICHSKGGIDTQTALVYYGAYPYVNLVHQLSTPNKGSELADMAYSTWTSWLASIMGQKDDAVYSLQTSWMANYRAQTDGRAENNYTRTYMSGGTGDDGIFSSSYYSRAFLPGEDDGAVAIYSAFGLPNGYNGFTDNGSERLSHTKMHYASKTWWQVRPRLTTTSYAAIPAAGLTASANKTGLEGSTSIDESSNNIMRGGAINGLVSDSFQLESGINGANVDVMTSSTATDVQLVSPSGKVYKAQSKKQGTDDSVMFDTAVHNVFSIDKPEKGTWTLQAKGDLDAYFMVATIDGGSKAKLNASKKVVTKAEKDVAFNVELDGAKATGKVKNAKVVKANKKGKSNVVQDVQTNTDANGKVTAAIATPTESGVYNVSMDVTAVNAKGEEFTRSVNYNFAVLDDKNELN